jgi:prophage maintenance system killer protein
MKRLTKEQTLFLHQALIDEHGGSEGIRDEGLLESALDTPFQTFSESNEKTLSEYRVKFSKLFSFSFS